MADVAVLSDTHVYHDPAETVPEWVRDAVAAADCAVHAGDFVTPTALDFFEDHARELIAVRGNADVSGVDPPEVATLSVEGVTLVVTHPPDVGDASLEPEAYREAVLSAVPERVDPEAGPVVAIAGHTHRIIDERVGRVRLLNPGSATAALPAERATMLRLTVEGEGVEVDVLTGGDG